MSSVRVRFAPSPTGYLHIGGLRTALYVYFFARKNNGKLVLRIEDTDRTRFVEDAEADIYRGLKWAGIEYDEGPDVGGAYGPYRQSERTALYQKYAAQLVERGNAYYAFDSSDELEKMRSENGTGYNAVTRSSMRNSLVMSDQETDSLLADTSVDRVIRLRVPENDTVVFDDVCRGRIEFATAEIDDQVLIKSDGLPTYHMANVVDDHLMEISHIIRGEDWLSSTPKHVLLYRALAWKPPVLAHLPLILSPTGGKLSKRKAEKQGINVFVSQYIDAGYEPEAVVNFLALLGWNPGTDQEIFSMSELIDTFSLERVGTSGVQFDADKLNWINEQYVRTMSPSEVAARLGDTFNVPGFDHGYHERVVEILLPRISQLKDIPGQASYFFEDPKEYDEAVVAKRWRDESTGFVQTFRDKVERLDNHSTQSLHDVMNAMSKDLEVGFGKLILPVRLAITGVGSGPGIFEVMELIGKDATLRRLDAITQRLG